MNLVIEDGRAILKASPNPFLLNAVRALEGRRTWLKGGGLSIEPTPHNISILREAIPALTVVRPEASPDVEEWAEDVSRYRPPYVPKTQPYAHQRAALAAIGDKPCFALFMDQGTGKTKVAIDRAGQLFCAGAITGLLVITKKGVHRQWADSQLPTHCGVPFVARYWKIKEVPEELYPEDGTLKVFTINVDAIKFREGAARCHSFIDRHRGRVMVIIDESQDIKDISTQRWKAAYTLGQKVKHRMILTGTPIAKDLTDEWSQLRWLDEEILGMRYKSAFRNEYCIMGGFEGKAVIGHRNIARFRSKTDPYSFRVTRADIGLLPPRYEVWNFDMTKKQRDMIRELKTKMLTQIETGEIASAATAAVAFMKIQEVTNGWFMSAPETEEEEPQIVPIFSNPLDNPRIEAMLDLIGSLSGKAVIWARFREDIRQIENALASQGETFVTYHGGTKDSDRKAAVDSFLNPEGARFFVSNPAAGGTGLNLQGACETAIYYSNSDNSIDRWQSEARIHRIGGSDSVIYYDLTAVGGVDKAILKRTRNKESISQMGIGDFKAMLENEL